MTKKFISVVPFWPLRVIDSQNYFLLPALMARKQGYQASIFVISSDSEEERTTYQGIHLKFFSSVFSLYQNLPPRSILCLQTSQRTIFLILFLLFLRKKKSQIIWVPRTSFGKGHPSNLPFDFLRIFSFFFKRLDQIVAISKHEALYLKNLGYNNVFYLPLLLDKKRFALGPKAKREGDLRLLFVGGDRTVKGVPAVLRAVSILRQLGIKTRLYVLGQVNPSFVEKHAALISSEVELLGLVKPSSPQLAKIFSSCDGYINNSSFEGPCVVAFESVAAGLFLCLSALPTLKEQFGENALYHQPDNYSQLVESILFYLFNLAIAKKHLQENQKAITDLSLSKFKLRFAKLLREL